MAGGSPLCTPVLHQTTPHDTTAADDKKLNTTLKKLGVTNIPGIEEANMFKENGEVIHFKNPKGALRAVVAATID